MIKLAEISSKELADALGVSRAKIQKWRNEGMPCRKNERGHLVFDEHAVERWLIQNGHAEEPDTILRTRAEVAEYFGVNVRTVAGWIAMADFPGRSGDKFERNGEFPVRAIDEWLSKRELGPYRSGESDDDSIRELRLVKIALAKLELERKSGELVDREEVARFIGQQHAIAKQILGGIVSQVMSSLPGDLDDFVKDDVRARLDLVFKKCCAAFAAKFEQRDESDAEETSE